MPNIIIAGYKSSALITQGYLVGPTPPPPLGAVTALRCTYVVQGSAGGPVSEQLVALPQAQPVIQQLAAGEYHVPFGLRFTPWLDATDSISSILSLVVADIGVSYGNDVAVPALLTGQSLSATDRGTVIFTLGDGATAQPGHSYHVTAIVVTASGERLEARTPAIICPF